MMVGDRQKYNCALITLKVKPTEPEGSFSNQLDGEARLVRVCRRCRSAPRADAAPTGRRRVHHGRHGAQERQVAAVHSSRCRPIVSSLVRARSRSRQRPPPTGIDKANNTAAVSRASRIQKFRILDGDFSVPGGDLTATLKLRRKPVTEKHQHVIDEMYAEADE